MRGFSFFYLKMNHGNVINMYIIKGLTFQHILKTFQHIRKTLQHISLYNTFFNQNAKKKLYNTFHLCV